MSNNKILKNIRNFIDNHVSLITFLLYIPFICSVNDSHGMNVLKGTFNIIRLLSGLIIVLISLFIKPCKPSKLFWALFAMQIWQFTATCLTNKKIVVSIYDFVAAIAIPLLIEMFLDKPKDVVKGLMFAYEVMLLTNFVSIFSYDGQLFQYGRTYLLGYYANMPQFVVPAIALAMVNYKICNNKYRPLLLIIISILTLILTNSGIGKAVLLAIIVMSGIGYLLYRYKKIVLPLTLLFISSFLLSIFFILVFTDYIEMPAIVTLFIEKVLHKSTTLTGRNVIWNEVIRLIKISPMIGYGFRETVTVPSFATVGHAHNAFLGELYIGGIPLFILFMYFHIILCKKSDSLKPSMIKCY